MTQLLHRFGLTDAAAHDAALAEAHAPIIDSLNTSLTAELDALRDQAAAARDDANLSVAGKAAALQQLRRDAGQRIDDALAAKMKAIAAWRYTAERDRDAALLPGVHSPSVLEGVAADARVIAARDAPPAQLMRDSEGRPVLSEPPGSHLAAPLAELLDAAAEESAKLMVLGLHTASPINQLALGGRDVVRELRRRLAVHVAPGPLKALDLLDSLDSVLHANVATARVRAGELAAFDAPARARMPAKTVRG
jgi:hypothetical protein